MEEFERRYTTAEVAKMYQCSPITVTRWIRNGRLTAVNLSGSCKGPYAIRPKDLEAFERNFETNRKEK